jgi:hypothetical protein
MGAASDRLTKPVPQAHQIYDRVRRIVDPDQLAGRGLDVGKAKLERLGIKPENPFTGLSLELLNACGTNMNAPGPQQFAGPFPSK